MAVTLQADYSILGSSVVDFVGANTYRGAFAMSGESVVAFVGAVTHPICADGDITKPHVGALLSVSMPVAFVRVRRPNAALTNCDTHNP